MGADTQTFLAGLKRLKEAGAPWHELARALRDRAGGGNAAAYKLMLADAARELGMSPVVLSRYVGLLDRLHAIAASEKELESLLPPRFSSGEIAARLHDRNPEKGRQAFLDLRARRTTLEKLRAELAKEEVPRDGARGRSLRDRGRAVEEAQNLLTSRAGRLFGAGARVVRRPPVRHLARVGFDILAADGALVAGADLYVPEPPASGRDPLEPLARSLLLSFYTGQFYLAFAPGFEEEELRRAARVLDAFGAGWVGILAMPEGRTVQHYRAPSSYAPPVPGRAALYDGLRSKLVHHRWTEALP